jgi:Helix-turn-helix domain
MEQMEHQGVRETFKYQLKLTPQQEQALAFVMCRCRELYNAALEERREAWERCGVSITLASQSAQLPEIKEVRPEYRDHNAALNILALGKDQRSGAGRAPQASTWPNGASVA